MEAAVSSARVTKTSKNGSDRLSCLPDELLVIILSFLPTKYSVRTRILSTRWKYLFAYVPVLDFQFPASTSGNHNKYYYCDSRTRFIDFVNKVFMFYNVPHITKFRLCCGPYFFRQLDIIYVTWISSAICRNVRELDLSMVFIGYKPLPRELFSCESLSRLKLDGDFWLKFPNSGCLPCLKILHLRGVLFDNSSGKFLSTCPVLEDLLLDNCELQYMGVLDISHPTLLNFSLKYGHDYDLVLNAPSLLCFEFLDSSISSIRGEVVLTSLIKARICYKPVLIELVSIVSHARHLYFSKRVIEEFLTTSTYSRKVPTFLNLTHLEVGKVSRRVLRLLPDLLNRSRHLEVLVFAEGFKITDEEFIDEESEDTELVCFNNVPSCVSGILKEIEFREFSMQENECKLVEYFLRTAQVLDKMKIQSHMNCKEQSEFSKKLLTFSKFSRGCQIVIDGIIQPYEGSFI